MNIEIQELLDAIYKADIKDLYTIESFLDELIDEGYCKEYLYKILGEEFQIEPIKRSISVTILSYIKPELNYIYKLYHEGVLVYIGQSLSLHQRLKTHRRGKIFSEVEIYLCQFYENPDYLESWLISKYQPYYNKTLNLHFARLWDKEEPVFKNIKDHNYLFNTTVSYLENGNTDYSRYLCVSDRSFPYIRNDKNIEPYWLEAHKNKPDIPKRWSKKRKKTRH